jgi:hypothetical protein
MAYQLKTIAVALISSCLLVACGGQSSRVADDEDGPKGWNELPTTLPTYPQPQNLVEFAAGPATNSNRFYIDPSSISIGTDGVVRYTLVVRTGGGGENVSYEGMRCSERQQKSYAFGRSDRTWTPARTSEWRRIEPKDINRHYGVLYVDYFCPDRKRPIKTVSEAIQRLKYGVPSNTAE